MPRVKELTLEMHGVTDTGRVRPENEDAIGVYPEIGLAILADGMGGHQAGEVASGMAIDVISRHFIELFRRALERESEGQLPEAAMEVNAIYDAVQLANNAIFEMAKARPECAGMGSTVVIAVFYGEKLCVGHVGDSRIYRYRAGELTHVTEDHSVVQELVSRGLLTLEEAQHTVGKNLVTRALGVDVTVAPDVAEHDLEETDIFLLCSDGLNDMLSDEEIRKVLVENEADLDEATHQLVNAANDHGGADNVSVVLVRANAAFKRTKKAARELQNRLKQA